jgi:hypothetical protein
LIFDLPLTMQPDLIHGVNAYWIRCRIEPRPDDPQNMYKKSPRIRNITAHTLGATTAATHAVIVQEEIIGRSSGDAGQIFQLRYKPVLALRDGETVEIERLIGEDEETVFVPWERVDDFADSDRMTVISPSIRPAVRLFLGLAFASLMGRFVNTAQSRQPAIVSASVGIATEVG